MKRSEILFALLRIPLDFAMTVAGILVGYQLRLKGDFIPGVDFILTPANLLPIQDYFEISLLFGGLLVLVFAFFGLYDMKNTEGPLHESRRVAKHSIVWFLLVMTYFFLTRKVFFSRLVLIYGFFFSLIFVVLARLVLRQIEKSFLKRNIGRRNVLIIGSNKIAQRITRALQKDWHYNLKGYISEQSKEVEGLKRLGTLTDLQKIIRSKQIEAIIVTDQNLTELQDKQILKLCHQSHIEYRFVPEILEVERSNIEIEPLAGFPLIHLKPTPLDGWKRIVKRCFDIVGSASSLILLSPIFTLIAIGIKRDSAGPVFFSKLEDGSPASRVGQNGTLFTFYKFRTMKHNTHHLRFTELAQKSHRKGPLMKIKDDPRITPFGRKLRRSSLDELPNLWNVLKGDMSLVGPRPHLPEEVEKYEDTQHFLLTIKPGITGLSQISGRSDLDFEEEVRLDSYYIKHWSLWMDLKILAKTLFVVWGGKAAD
ncbi:sugar transferase [Candidatus Peregrinibacteria bacterium]|nr:MAG: sugar transferase [Candidatus Peregrinibacteria bacterium]